LVLIGLDVGFSATRRSSGVARLGPGGDVRVGHTTSAWEARRELTGTERADVVAIDAPYTTSAAGAARSCERVLARGAFQRRCKPGLSHVRGTGRTFRAAGWDSARQLKALAPARALAAEFPRVDGCNVVEAFPNAWLGVCLPAELYAEPARLRRGRKFDWLYDHACRLGLFRGWTAELGLPGDSLARECASNRHHDERAALVCLLTAAAVARGRYVAVGDRASGYIFLPPWPCWSAWAREALERERASLPGLELWSDGRIRA
jgi:predicted nuclease with RNAse H fold